MDDAIEVRDLVVERGKRPVLHGISCAIPRGASPGCSARAAAARPP